MSFGHRSRAACRCGAHECPIASNCIEPGRWILDLGETFALSKRDEEGLLEGVFGKFAAREHLDEELPETALVGRDEKLE